MRTSALFALSVGLGAALLGGCGGPPLIGTPLTDAQALRPTTSSFQVLYRFGSNGTNSGGQNPSGGLIDVGGTLYGTTQYGGLGVSGGGGVVYSVTTSGAEKALYSFRGYEYGDGFRPVGGVIDVKGTLYGTTEYGGHCDAGTVYSLSTTGTETVLHSFCYSSGGNVGGGLVYVKGTLYGTTSSGGTSGDGVVYSLSTSGAYKVLYSFKGGADGINPTGTLLNVKGTLYGVTFGGGTGCSYGDHGCGTVYSITKSGQEKVLHTFPGAPDGALPIGGLIDVNGTLYGATNWGGIAPGSSKGDCPNFSCGTVYSITTSGKEKVLYRFRGGSHGASPSGRLIEMNKTLYGSLSSGNTCGSGSYHFGCGMIFRMTTSGKNEQAVHKFRGSDGAEPNDLIDVNGAFYGSTYRGGDMSACNGDGCGTVFEFTP